ncbi:hypothetical protein L1987_52535 [Smallanthus sonchifolius]|uniref:Uncharacterized protein n=1 Tax=Smallanthus sonchifolius TaxID=185202 RepID=A0ACB9ETE4_9ASTR|nr:hypothetical protein L1987_52535 [Smallanthus sonchifolius]
MIRAECACNPVRYFVISSTQRSGSGWFGTLLNSHMNVSSNGEIFSVKPRRCNISAIGLMQNHEAIVEYFNTKGVSVIFLFRRNLLRRRISILANAYDQSATPLNGKHKSHVHSPDEAKILASYKPAINTTLLIPELKQADNMVKQALEFFNTTRHIILYYEDIIKNNTSGLKGPRQPWHDLHCKIDGPAAHDVLKNFEQRWKKATKWSRVGQQIFRSVDSGSLEGFPKDTQIAESQNLGCAKNVVIDTSIQKAYIQVIRSAEHFIHIENQYFLGSSYAWSSNKDAGADHLIPMELSLKIASKIKANER